MDKQEIDKQAEREAKALHKQGQYNSQQHGRQRIGMDYNKAKFDKLFKEQSMKQEQGLTYCCKEKRGIGKALRTSKKYCSICDRKIRGKNHEQGKYHVLKVEELKNV